ncbi:MAG: polysaccharide biosynthesis tyrosine autokinase [Acidimicrobiales bacterium]
MAEDSYASVDLADYLRVIQRRKWLILLVIVVMAVLAFAYSKSQSTLYTTGVLLKFAEPDDLASPNPRVLQAYSADEASFVRSTTVASQAAKRLKTDVEPRMLLKDLSVVATESLVVNVRYTGKTPLVTQARAQAFADAYIDLRGASAREDRDRLLAVKDREIAALEQAEEQTTEQLARDCSPEVDNTALCLSTSQDLGDITTDLRAARLARDEIDSVPIDSGTIFSPAPLPKAPSSAGPVRTVALGGIMGLVLGLCLAFVRDRLDSRVRNKGEIEAAIGLIPMASIPLFDDSHRTPSTALVTVHAPDSAEADSFRRLRASVLIAAEAAGARVIAFTSAKPGEGKSTVSSNLAVSLSQAGNSVALLSTDIRRPSLEKLFGVVPGPGLGEVLEGSIPLDRAVLLITSSLAVLPSGNAEKANPSDLLLNNRMSGVLESLRDSYDYVIVDTPPVLAVADTLGMVSRFDAVVLVVSLDANTSAEVTDAEEQLQRVGAQLIGAVINRAAPNSQHYDAYQQRDPKK